MESKGVRPNVVSYNILIAAYAKQFQPGKAAEWIQRMKEAGIMPDVVSYSTVIDAYAKASQAACAAHMLHGCSVSGVDHVGVHRC